MWLSTMTPPGCEVVWTNQEYRRGRLDRRGRHLFDLRVEAPMVDPDAFVVKAATWPWGAERCDDEANALPPAEDDASGDLDVLRCRPGLPHEEHQRQVITITANFDVARGEAVVDRSCVLVPPPGASGTFGTSLFQSRWVYSNT